jgi:hypothetical integral membrane protein (TIGR02206 family)
VKISPLNRYISPVAGLLSAEHLGALAATGVAAILLIAAARTRKDREITYICRAFAVVLAADEISWWVFLAAGGAKGVQLAQALPLQVCDVTSLIAALALWFRRPLLVELTYFWGLAGSFQGLLTPDLPQHFPTYTYLQYYIAHGGIVAAALMLVVGLRLYPRRLAVGWVALLTVAYAVLLGLLDAVTGANYMYLRSKPAAPTLLDLFGPWPWYLLGAAALGVLFLAILDAPFYFGRRRCRQSASPSGALRHLPRERGGDHQMREPELVLLFDGT